MRTVRKITTSVVLLTLFATSAAAVDKTLVKKQEIASFWGKFKASAISMGTNLGTGTFYSKEGTFPGDDGSDNPLVSNELTLYPRFNITETQSIRARWGLECEWTDPDRNPGRACDHTDIRLSYSHAQLWQDPLLHGKFNASAAVYVPISYGSLNNNTITNVRLGAGYRVSFFNNKLDLRYSFGVQKYLQTSKVRDKAVTDGSIGTGDAEAGTTGSGSRMNDNWMFVNSFDTSFAFNDQWAISMSLIVQNFIRYSVPEDQFSVEGMPTTGRADNTWGVIEGSYSPLPYLSVALGVSSFQPALTAQGKLRFPFYDFITPQDNYTRWYLSVTATY